MEDDKKPHPIITIVFMLFLMAFFGGGLLLIVNLFVPFLPEAAFAAIALIVGGMLLVLLVIGKCVQVVTALRSSATTNSSLNGAEASGSIPTLSEAQPGERDSFAEVMDRCNYDRPESVFDDVKRLAEAGHVDAAYELAGILARPGQYHDPESAYKWYYISLSQQGYSVEFEDENHTPPYYCGPVGDFRNECIVSDLVDGFGFDKVRSLDAEAARWIAEWHQSPGRSRQSGRKEVEG